MTVGRLKVVLVWLASAAFYGLILAPVFPGGTGKFWWACAYLVGGTTLVEGAIGVWMTPIAATTSTRAATARGLRRGLAVAAMTAASMLGIGVIGALLSQYLLAFGVWWFFLIVFSGPFTVLSSVTSAITVEFMIRGGI